MSITPAETILYLGAILFCVGFTIVISKRNLIMMMIGIELMLNAANLNLVAFNTLYADSVDGRFFILFIIVVAVCEAAVGIGLVLRVYHFYKTSSPDQIRDLKEKA
jgi:NADH:ubiquinone oxidoreductase subunit K